MSRNPVADDYEASVRRSRAPADGLPLFAPTDPSWLADPKSKIEWEFRRFHDANPAVYDRLERAALAWSHESPKRIGVKRLVENLRFSAIATDRSFWQEFKLNNDLTALYARLLIYRHASLADYIETRGRREDGASSDANTRGDPNP